MISAAPLSLFSMVSQDVLQSADFQEKLKNFSLEDSCPSNGKSNS